MKSAILLLESPEGREKYLGIAEGSGDDAGLGKARSTFEKSLYARRRANRRSEEVRVRRSFTFTLDFHG